jgi:nitrilase
LIFGLVPAASFLVLKENDMTHEDIILSTVQMVSTDDIEQNLLTAEKLVRKAAISDGANLVLLPENFLCFSAKKYVELAKKSEDYVERFASLAQELGVDLVLGSLPFSYRPDGSMIEGKLRSASIAINHQGKVVARYDKRHLFDVKVADEQGEYFESNEFEPGQELVVAHLGESKVGLSICYDLRFPAHYQALRDLGAKILCIPAAFTYVTGQAHWETLLRARAIENQCYVVAANQGGIHSPERETWGHSMIIDPWGKILASVEKGEGYCSSSIDLSFVDDLRQKMPVQDHRKNAEL